MLNISFLGKVTFEVNGENITEKIGSKAAALVALLMLHTGRDMLREKIINYLWSDSSEDAAKYNLRYNLWQLKKNIAKDAMGQDFIAINKDYCRINMDYDFACDILTVMNFRRDLNYTIEDLTARKNLFSGDFFQGFYFNNCDEFNEFILYQRNYFEGCRVKILKRLAELLEESSNYEACIDVISNILELEPYDENLAAKIMELYAANENRGSAIKFYKSFCNRLVYDLGIEPSQKLKNQYEELKKSICETPASMRQNRWPEPVASQASEIILETDCMPRVPFFWMADCFEKLCANQMLPVKALLTSTDLLALSFIAPYGEETNSPSSPVPVPEVRIVKAFIRLIQRVCVDHILTLKISNEDAMDDISAQVLKYLSNQSLKNLVIVYK